LENEDSGFEKNDKRIPKGYAKIEVRNGKGLLNVYVQDLKYFKDAKYIYRNYLINTKGKKGAFVNTGTFIIDEKGKGELKVKFNPDNVEGSGKSIEEFNVVAVIAEPIKRSSEGKEIYGPLVGYMDKDKEKVNWKDVIVYEDKKTKKDNDLDKEYKEKYEEIINLIEKSSKGIYKENQKNLDDYEKEDNKKHKEEQQKEYSEHDEEYYKDKEEIEPEKKEEVKPEKKEEVKPEKKEEVKSEKKEEVKSEKKEEVKPEKKEEVKPEKKEEVKPEKKKEVKPEKKEEVKPEKKSIEKQKNKYNVGKRVDVHYKKYHKMVYKYIKDILKYYEKAEPFEKNIDDYRWWKINYDKKIMYRGFLPFFGYILSIYSFNPYIYYMNNCYNLMNKYGHYIFGIAYDKDMEPKYYVYGVPGKYSYTDQPFQGMTGFVSWYPIENKKPEKGDYGYWLLHIDAMTGNAVFPMKPTIPPKY
jgi:hypothetical protein